MRKLIVILLCLPLFLFSQTEKKYERVISISDFLNEVYDAIDNNKDIEFKNTQVVFSAIDKKFLNRTRKNNDIDHNKYRKEIWTKKYIPFRNDALILKELRFRKLRGKSDNKDYYCQIEGRSSNSNISIENCDFKCNISFLNNRFNNISILNSNFHKLRFGNFKNINLFTVVADEIVSENSHIETLNIINSQISNIFIGHENSPEKMHISTIRIESSEVNRMNVLNTIFINKFNTLCRYNENNERILIENSFMDICNSNIQEFNWESNSKEDENNINDSLFFSYINELKSEGHSILSSYSGDCTVYNGRLSEYKSISKKHIDLYIDNKPFKIIKQENSFGNIIDTIKTKPIIYLTKELNIRYTEFNSIVLKNGNTNIINISNSIVNETFKLDKDFKVDSIFGFSQNILPDYSSRVSVEWANIHKLCVNTDQSHVEHFFDGMQDQNITVDYSRNYRNIISSYMNFIKVFNDNGEKYNKYLSTLSMKDVETSETASIYKSQSTIKNYFKWKGSLFLKYYCEYGLDPFQGLFYCFKMILYFALFYFFFYSDWDKIDRGFLIKRFNSVMDYFTTKKRIEDFYSTTHTHEMTTFTDFKDTLNKNKVYMPSMLSSLAKPIYKLSLLRYRMLNFSYKKAEFMAGNRWIDLEKKDRFWIGILTFFLTITYIVYLVSIRALNSIVLSINAFSTLGFGQIPVRGFTKYVAIIQGFIGWFLLSVFIVSLINQMMSV